MNPANYVQWPNGGGFQPVDIYIDGRFLVDIVEKVERPLFAQEAAVNVTPMEIEDGNLTARAGDYLSLPASLTCLPSRNLLGEPFDGHPFDITPDCLHWGKSILLYCTCGITEC